MDCKLNNELGNIFISDEVIAAIAGTCCLESIGVVGMGAKRGTDGLVDILRGDNIKKGVRVTIKENLITVGLSIVVEYGVSIAAVAQTIIESVKYHIETYTGMTVDKINVSVEGIRV